MKKNNILIIGGSGFIGSYLLKINTKKLAFFSDKSSIKKKIFNLRFRLTNTRKILRIINKYNITTIVHLASKIYANSNKKDYLSEKKNIVQPTIRLLKNLKDKNFIFLSSGGTIYGNKINATENSKLIKTNYLSRCKIKLENEIIKYSKINNLNYLILRPSNIYGYKKKSIQSRELLKMQFIVLNLIKNFI